MSYAKFYKRLFQPIEECIGALDAETSMAIIGFDCGGPVSLTTVGRRREKFVTYVTCELAVRNEQPPASFGRYEVMMSCDEERWARNVLTKVGQMSMQTAFGSGRTLDISQVVEKDCPMRGLVVEEFARVRIDGNDFGILRFSE